MLGGLLWLLQGQKQGDWLVITTKQVGGDSGLGVLTVKVV